jgi:2-(1,2-epoxy-1,2-dihydrophenyl)acetyl-CoA isomerase
MAERLGVVGSGLIGTGAADAAGRARGDAAHLLPVPTTEWSIMTEAVRLTITDGVADLVLSAVERGNALDLAGAEQLRDTATELGRAAELRAVVLRAEGRNFCVGGDLKAFLQHDDMGGYLYDVASAAHVALQELLALPVPLVVAVQGAAAGAGVGLALAGDVIVVEHSTKLRLAYTAVGLSPDNGSSWLLPRLVGARRATELVLTNRVVTGADALAWGLASEVVDDGRAGTRALEIAAGLARGSRESLVATKRLIRESVAATDFGAHLELEAKTISGLAGTAEARAAIERFVHR